MPRDGGRAIFGMAAGAAVGFAAAYFGLRRAEPADPPSAEESGKSVEDSSLADRIVAKGKRIQRSANDVVAALNTANDALQTLNKERTAATTSTALLSLRRGAAGGWASAPATEVPSSSAVTNAAPQQPAAAEVKDKKRKHDEPPDHEFIPSTKYSDVESKEEKTPSKAASKRRKIRKDETEDLDEDFAVDVDKQGEFTVSSILAGPCNKSGRKVWHVQWLNDGTTWEPEEHLFDCTKWLDYEKCRKKNKANYDAGTLASRSKKRQVVNVGGSMVIYSRNNDSLHQVANDLELEEPSLLLNANLAKIEGLCTYPGNKLRAKLKANTEILIPVASLSSAGSNQAIDETTGGSSDENEASPDIDEPLNESVTGETMAALEDAVVEHADSESTTAKSEDVQGNSKSDHDNYGGGEDRKLDEDVVDDGEYEDKGDVDKVDADNDEAGGSLTDYNESQVLTATDKVPQADSTKTWKERLDGLTIAEAYKLLRSHGISTPRAGLKYYLDYGYVVLS